MNIYVAVWMFPLLSALMWLGMLLGMLLKWVTDGKPQLITMNNGQTIPYISDIGALELKPLFITGSVITVVALDLAILSERWLRHRGVLVPNQKLSEKVLSVLGIIFAIAGAAGLILLSIFDTLRYPRLHDGFLLLFIGGYIISAIFTCAEYQRLGIHVRQHRILRVSFWVKLFFIIVEVILAICFGALTFTSRRQPAAVFEWVIALVFTFWVLSYFVDLLPAYRDMRHGGGEREAQMEFGEGANGFSNGNGHTKERHNGTNGHF